jgi:hypothetical protein
MLDVRRREFITLLGGAAAWPLAAWGAAAGMLAVDFPSTTPNAPFVAAFRQGLKESGERHDRISLGGRWTGASWKLERTRLRLP